MIEYETNKKVIVAGFTKETAKALKALGFKIEKSQTSRDSDIARFDPKTRSDTTPDLNIYTPKDKYNRLSFQAILHSSVFSWENQSQAIDRMIETAKKLIELLEKLKEI